MFLKFINHIIIVIFLNLLLVLHIRAQKEGNIWYFGSYAGLDFNSGSPVALTNSAMYTRAGCASISDTNGNLLFYTNGWTVWNKNNLIMANGTGLLGDTLSSQSALIAPLPGSLNKYYIFTVAAFGGPNGFRYSIIDMSLNSGLGAVIVKNVPLITPVCEKITAVKKANSKYIWILTHLFHSDAFYAYLLTSSGLDTTPVITHIGSYHGDVDTAAEGYMKISPDSKTLAIASCCRCNPFTELLDFNNVNGTISNARKLLYNSNPIDALGMEFSPDGSKLYLSFGFIYQLNIKLPNINAINNSLKVIYSLYNNVTYNAIQLASDGKIYISKYPSGNAKYMSSINNPNDTGISCNFIINSVYLDGRACRYGLPTFIQSYFYMPDFKTENMCFEDSTLFNITNKSILDSVVWNFGDIASGNNNFSKLFYPKHKFSDTGNYNIILIYYQEGLSDTLFRKIYIGQKPSVLFTINDTSQCLSQNNFLFTNYSNIITGNINYYHWDFGDSNVYLGQTPAPYVYMYPDTFKITLTAISDLGCINTFSRQAIVKPSPSILFTVNDTTQCLKANNFVFTNKSSIVKNTALTYKWYFGNGDSSTAKNPVYTYKTAGNYNIFLVAKSNIGCVDTLSGNTVVFPQSKPSFSVNDSDQCLNNNLFNFTNNTSSVPVISKWHWDFGDGKTDSSFNTSHHYTISDTIITSLITTTSNGCKDTTEKMLVINPSPDAVIIINNPVQCLTGNSFDFGSSIPEKSYLWIFGDANSSNLAKPLHSYLLADTFNVSLIQKNSFNCSDTVYSKVIVFPMPKADFLLIDSAQCLVNNNFAFKNVSTISNGSLTYNWYFGDGNFSVLQNPDHIFTSADTFNVKLLAKSNNGCPDSISQNIIVFPMPKPGFSLNDSDQCLRNNNFIFNNTSTISSGSLSYNWNFDDGSFSMLQNPVHVFNSTGTFKVKLLAESNNNCFDSTTQNIIVYPMPKADISVNDSSQCLKGNSFVFINSNPLSTINNQWWFGDGKSDTGFSVTHSYLNSGSYIITLAFKDKNNCRDTSQKNITVLSPPVTVFNVNDTAQCLNKNSFVFNCPSAESSYNWNFGDGSKNSGKTVIHKYLKADTFNVKLIITDNAGCTDSLIKNIVVLPLPDASFTVNNTVQCLKGNSFVFGNSNQLLVISRQWEFGDLDSSALQNPSHTYVNEGNYTVNLIVTTKDNCSDISFKSIIIKPSPATPSISSNSPVCERESLKLTANSDAGSSYKWTADNGFVSAVQNPVISSIQFNDSGNYYVQAILNGCASDTATTHIIIYPAPYFDLGNNKTICDGDVIILDPGNFESYLWQDSSTQRLFNVTASGIYSVKVFNSFGCSYEDSVEIIKKCPTTLYIPDAFSPNNDGHNDKFEIIAENIKEYNLIIFSRWGEKIFRSNDPQNSWDGTYKGSQCPVGVYYYQLYIRANDGEEKTMNGTVTIVK